MTTVGVTVVAQVTRVQLVDDLDGSEAAESVSFALDGTSYEIDLNADNASTFREVFMQYVSAGRKLGGRGRGAAAPAERPARSTGRRGRKEGEPDPKEVRAWAESQGIEVSKRGRVPANLVAQFSAGH